MTIRRRPVQGAAPVGGPRCGSAGKEVVTAHIFLHHFVDVAELRRRPPHTGLVATRSTLNTRWVTLVMVAALVCSVVVVWGLIQITGQSPASSSTPSASDSPAPSAAGSPAGTDGSSAAPTTETPDTSGSEVNVSDVNGSDVVGSDVVGSDVNASDTTRGSTTTTATPAPLLPGSALRLPAAWTGTAELTITVLGRCAATGGTSSYTRSAALALQGPVVGTGPFDDPNPMSMTLGISPAGIPGVSVYSASTGKDGTVHRTWWLTSGTAPDAQGRTLLSGVLIDDQPVSGALPPNLLVDNETDLQPCESGGTVRVPRTLAAGSTVTGWVSATDGHLDLTAKTTDGERALTAVITLSRKPAA